MISLHSIFGVIYYIIFGDTKNKYLIIYVLVVYWVVASLFVDNNNIINFSCRYYQKHASVLFAIPPIGTYIYINAWSWINTVKLLCYLLVNINHC